VSSRPHASVKLREIATVSVNILGVAEEERKLYIEQSLKEHPEKAKELTSYLESHLTINSLCYVPFIMVALLHLCDQGITLPSNSVELYHRFVCLTICRHFVRSGHPLNNDITNITNFPEPCNRVVKQLAELSFKALDDNKIIFTLEEIKAFCPDITAIPGAIDGFGLLQAVQHFGITVKAMTFNFSHYSIQEFLAAYHVAQLPALDELTVLREKFWSDTHANMFSIYTVLTNGQRPAFKHFLWHPSFLPQTFKQCSSSGRAIVSEKFLEKQINCLRLFRCFKETDNKEICQFIKNAKCFNDKVINLCHTTLSPYDIECITVFLMCSFHKEWKKLSLWNCHIQDIGLHTLHCYLTSHDIIIKDLDLSFNILGSSSSSSISDITIHRRVEKLVIDDNHTIGEDFALYEILFHPFSKLLRLHMMGTRLSNCAAIMLFTALAKGSKLQELFISNNLITDEACEVIAATLMNSLLVKLGMWGNKISAEAAKNLVQALKQNSTLEVLALPSYDKHVKRSIKIIEEEIRKKRESRGCQTDLEVIIL